MRRVGFILCIVTLLFNSCVDNSVVPCRDAESGVSFDLAVKRKAQISDVKYNLFFSIPDRKSDAIKATVEIEFKSNSNECVLLDFKGDAENILSVITNDKSSITVLNEHILLSPIRKGDNKVWIEFIAPTQSLNRTDEYLYTLLVPDRARTLFPCFDQPDMKALYSLKLSLPDGWKAVSNSAVTEIKGDTIVFGQTEPLSTYLFSFVAGELYEVQDSLNGRKISLYHRETEPYKVAQIKDIMSEVFHSLEWMEDYTAIEYPFSKYDLIILPGFQYGGMEHTGATLYADRTMFLSKNPTMNEKLARCELIAHETAHMWFGDYVTMAWFNDVWTKEVFANYFGSRIVEPQFPEINHELNFLLSYIPAAYSEDRTEGTNAIQQPLDNLQDAGLVYGNIIYTKSPVVMNMLVEMIGEEAFQKGIREYLTTYAYSNATWDDLIAILNRLTDIDLESWSDTWIKEKGMPQISSVIKNDTLVVCQSDKYGRGKIWSQKLSLLVDNQTVDMDLLSSQIKVPCNGGYVVPNIDGRSYGFFQLDIPTFNYLVKNICEFKNEVTRTSILITLYENVLNDITLSADFVDGIGSYLKNETNELIFSQALNYATGCYYLLKNDEEKRQFEELIFDLYNNQKGSYKTLLLRAYYRIAESEEAVGNCYAIWTNSSDLSERDAINISYELAIRMPNSVDAIVSKQLSRITNKDRVKEYLFVAPSVSGDKKVRDSVFNSLLLAKNREIEPYVESALGYLNHRLRADSSICYIRAGLDAVKEIQRTGDIFFPRVWSRALLNGHSSEEAKSILDEFFNNNPDYPVMLGNKIKQQAYFLGR